MRWIVLKSASTMAPGDAIMELKEAGNALFREGDFRGAADAFQRAVEAVQQMSSPTSDAADVELACLLNLAYAWIKQGSMEDAEAACCQVLKKKPTCVKALFRRGQARLALARFIEAATDFREVTILEPNNAEAYKMLRRAQQQHQQVEEGGDRPPPTSEVVGETCFQSPRGYGEERDNPRLESRTSTTLLLSTTAGGESPNGDSVGCVDQGDTRARPPLISTTTSGSGVPPPPENSSSGSCEVNGVKSEGGVNGEDTTESLVETSVVSSPTNVSSFMVPGWLSSAARRGEGDPQERGTVTFVDDPHCRSERRMSHGLSKAGASPRVQSAVSVSRLISKLSASQKDASEDKESQRGASATAAAHAEWSRLQAEESNKVQESRRKWSSAREGSHAAASATTSVNGEAVGTRRSGLHGRKKNGNKTPTSRKTAIAEKEPRETKQASEWWASLEEEESQVRKAFRAKLSIGETLAAKKKTQKKKTSVASHLRAGGRP